MFFVETVVFAGWFWDFPQLRTRRFRCLSVQGTASSVRDLVLEILEEPGSTLMLDRAEQLLHDWFGEHEYWAARR